MCTSRWCFLLVVLVTIAIRVAVIASDWTSLSRDDDSYARLACAWSQSGTFGFASLDSTTLAGDVLPTAYRPPAYPWLLSWLVEAGRLNLSLVAVLHVALGLATVVLVYAMAVRLHLACPALPAMAVACDPILLRGSQLVMTETLIACAATVLWAIWLQIQQPRLATELSHPHAFRRALFWSGLLGLSLGLAILIRPTILPWAMILVVLQWPRQISLRHLTPAAMTLVVLLSVLFPWALRNQRYLGQLVWTTTHGGYTLLLANNPLIYEHFRLHGVSRDWDANPFHALWAQRYAGDPTQASFWDATQIKKDHREPPIDELQDDRLAQQAAMSTIARQPPMFVASCFIRGLWFWALNPSEGRWVVKLAIGCWYFAWFAAAILGLRSLARKKWTPLWLGPLALVVTLTMIHAVYWSNMRMRAPVMPVVYMLASVSNLHRWLRINPESSCRPD